MLFWCKVTVLSSPYFQVLTKVFWGRNFLKSTQLSAQWKHWKSPHHPNYCYPVSSHTLSSALDTRDWPWRSDKSLHMQLNTLLLISQPTVIVSHSGWRAVRGGAGLLQGCFWFPVWDPPGCCLSAMTTSQAWDDSCITSAPRIHPRCESEPKVI